MPRELDIPHWAVDPVANFRKRMQAPDWLTDRMIYAAMTVIDNDDARRAEIVRDLAVITYLMQQKADEDAVIANHKGGRDASS
jgi:hypothetical protein